MTNDEIRNSLLKRSRVECDPDYLLNKFNELDVKYQTATGKEKDKFFKKIEKVGSEAIKVLGLETHYPIAEIAVERDRTMVIELCNQLIQEYDCKKASEKMLVHLIGGCYARTLVISRYLVNTVTLGHTTPGINTFMGVMSKELDRSERQLLSALTLLKEMKSPTLNIKVKANNAFIAQSQQLNNNQNNQESNETNKT